MTQYYCGDCQKLCQPYLCEVGVSSDCCWTKDAALMVDNSDGDWRLMNDAPTDGTTVCLLIRHENFSHDPSELWEQEVHAHWINFNSGGFTWHGMMGREIGWRPLRRPITESEERELAEELHAEADAERTPTERARQRVMSGS